MSINNTTLADLYVAAGGVISEDGNTVSLGISKPFEVVFRVALGGMEVSHGEPDKVTLNILLDDDYTLGVSTPMGTPVHHNIFDVIPITLPTNQVEFKKTELELEPGRWWRVMRGDTLWAETSSEEEARSLVNEPGDVLQNLHVSNQREWRTMPAEVVPAQEDEG